MKNVLDQAITRSVFYLKYRHPLALRLFVICVLSLVIIYVLPRNMYSHQSEDSYQIKQDPKHGNFTLVVLILTSPTRQGYERRRAIRDTWLRLQNNSVFHRFVIGGKNLSPNSTRDLTAENEDVLLLDDVIDSYNNLTRKVLSSFVWVYENIENFQYVLKTDDDSFVRLDTLYQELIRLDHPMRNRLYWGYMDGISEVMRGGRWAETEWVLSDRYVVHALGGGYVLSRELVEFLARNKHLVKIYQNEDVSVAAWLGGMDIYYRHDMRFDTEWKSRGCRNNYVITHKQEQDSMRRKYKRIIYNGRLCDHEFTVMYPYEYNWKALPSKCCQRNSSL